MVGSWVAPWFGSSWAKSYELFERATGVGFISGRPRPYEPPGLALTPSELVLLAQFDRHPTLLQHIESDLHLYRAAEHLFERQAMRRDDAVQWRRVARKQASKQGWRWWW